MIFKASNEVAGAVLTAVTTTVVSFLPVFTMIGAEGKLFRPLAFTKTFALAASVIVALTIIPPAAHVLMGGRIESKSLRRGAWFALLILGIAASMMLTWWVGAILIVLSAYKLYEERIPERYHRFGPYAASALAAIVVGVLLTQGVVAAGTAERFATESPVRWRIDWWHPRILYRLSTIPVRTDPTLVPESQSSRFSACQL